MPTKKEAKVVDKLELDFQQATFCIVGTAPLIPHQVGAKSKKELLCPRGRQTATDKKIKAKHHPDAEYLDCFHPPSYSGQSAIGMPAVNFKQAIGTVATEIPGLTATSAKRYVHVIGETIDVFGVPELFMTTVRNSDMNKTPDIRTRPILRYWCAEIEVRYVLPFMTFTTLRTLVQAAGILMGVGDWRIQKGSGNYGGWEICREDDERFLRIKEESTIERQMKAIRHPEPYDSTTAMLIEAWEADIKERGIKVESKEDLFRDWCSANVRGRPALEKVAQQYLEVDQEASCEPA